MRIDVVAAVPELLHSAIEYSIVGRAQQKGLVTIHLHNLHDFGLGKYRQIDDYPYGGGGGMVIRCEPVAAALDALLQEGQPDEIIFLSPEGDTWNQALANQFSLKRHLVLVCGHYKGIDQRVVDSYATRIISIGDYVLTGGEIAAAVLIDSVVRLLPGAIGDEGSALTDSFQDGLLAPPVYTRPEVWRGLRVPSELLSGNPRIVEEWRFQKALERTERKRSEGLKSKTEDTR
ncbi:MAG: tRNA (guanosine(37)-N1)-methyltransferase TrmD [Flavobacteriales bacterium]|nr:tRNA (guanosine(37)-N1)-methyltransferase TrmD [Flavobacteriales bacterium]MCX7767655.1 tRNA (guanosine(37)-N1)-methyltransferase TrmD [Flavobacteriales bacterium]MDW8409503.1 tRNA (guanosine(37)-N1)-methyltransferase TrmD [Flavobacteriales bacterium]